MEKQRVCVTGAGGFLASWVVKFLLSKGYIVRGSVRDPSDEKHAHLKNLENAADNLQLFKVDLLDYNTLCAAIAGCSVLHVASPCTTPVADPMAELIEPAVTGTLNVLKACTEAKVKRVVVVSSRAAAIWNPNWPKDQPIDESCWSDKEYLNTTKNWYALSKTDAESETWANAAVFNECKYLNSCQDYKRITEGEDKHKLSSEKLQKLGWTYITLEKSLADSVKCYEEKGILV
ncbi:hypothetical protein MKX01_005509 [Papaver californicum]|nr:hypothetical protein MKX01_005509 [Papaver californicum]